jgi:hypothetical protein
MPALEYELVEMKTARVRRWTSPCDGQSAVFRSNSVHPYRTYSTNFDITSRLLLKLSNLAKIGLTKVCLITIDSGFG